MRDQFIAMVRRWSNNRRTLNARPDSEWDGFYASHAADSFRFDIQRLRPASEYLIAWSEIRRANGSRLARLCTQRCVTPSAVATSSAVISLSLGS